MGFATLYLPPTQQQMVVDRLRNETHQEAVNPEAA
jgi:hypothetical protein